MRVLDLDLDFFLADCCPLAEKGERPDAVGHEPWKEADVRLFLERKCGLSESSPVPGRIFETHDGALRFWKERLEDGSLLKPFHVTHVDAHSDLGIGKPGPGFVLNGVLPRRPECRAELSEFYGKKQLDEANYLLFALAFRWISSLDNVRNSRSRKDIPPEILVPGEADRIQLSSFASRLMESQNGQEPVIPFRVFEDFGEFRAEAPYDYVTLAISPRYAPEEADGLADVIGRYIVKI